MTPQDSSLGAGVDSLRPAIQPPPAPAAPTPSASSEQAPPSRFLMATFILSLLPVIGYCGLVMAGFGLYRAYREQTRPHGLLYAAVVLQLFYTLILLVLVTVVFRTTPISTQGPKPTTGSAIVAEHFLLAVQSSDIDGAKALTDSAMFDQSEGNLKGLNDSIQFTPQLVSEQSIPVTNLKQTAVNVKYPNGAAALSLWRTGQTSSGQRFVAIVVVESAPEDWRIVMAQVLEATSSGVALQAAEQLTLLEPVVQ